MNSNDFYNIGEQIKNAVEDALDSHNFRQLSQKISQTINNAVRKPFVRVNPKGKLSSIPLIVLGGTCTFLFGFLTVSTVLVAFFQNTRADRAMTAIPFFLFASILAASAALLCTGIVLRKRYVAFRQYLQILDGRAFCSVKELADKTHKPEKQVCRELKAIIRKGMFMDGFLDPQGACLIVTREAYQQFCQAQESRRLREAEQARAATVRRPVPETAVSKMLQKGNEYLASIRSANDSIPGTVISAKLSRLELVTRKIFESVKEHPEQIDEMDRFMEYYLPTIRKLINAYKEFDALPVKGENVRSSMEEIEKTLDTVNHAFEQFLDDLFQDAALDISSDISVLHTMLAKEGYQQNDFK